MNKNKHLTLELRNRIELGLNKGHSFKEIAFDIEKNCTTVSKEIRSHRVFEKTGGYGRHFNDCALRINCTQRDVFLNCSRTARTKCVACAKCLSVCPLYRKETCTLLSKPPYVCNGCSNRHYCTLEKAVYRALAAQKEYELVRSESRSGFNITEQELDELNRSVSPLILNGQSIHHICTSNPGLIRHCEKTIYNYADAGLLTAKNLDMPHKVRFKIRKKKSVSLKVDKSCRIGRSIDDFRAFMSEHPELPLTELDTVEGVKGGACLLTVHAVLPKLQFAFKRISNNAASVADVINWIYDCIGHDSFCRIFPVLLCDNGSEFSDPLSLEFNGDGVRRCHVFYCHPSAPHEKGACENNHEFIRKIIPKGKDISPYSLVQIERMMSHINSYGRPDLGDKSPYEVFSFLYGEEVLTKLHVSKIERNMIILRPSLMRKKQ